MGGSIVAAAGGGVEVRDSGGGGGSGSGGGGVFGVPEVLSRDELVARRKQVTLCLVHVTTTDTVEFM